MARRRGNDDTVRVGDRVIAVEPIGKIPEGMAGTVKVVDGLTAWTRYWVRWENGAWTGSVSDGQVVRADRLDAYRAAKTAQATAAEQASSRAAAAASAPGGPPPPEGAGPSEGAGASEGAPAAAGETSRIPAHLLERSRAAKARKAAAG